MRKITSLVATLLIAAATFAQAPQGFSYQAVVRDAQNAIVANQTVEVNVTILQGAAFESAKAVFSEKHSAKTNANGLFTITIGSVNTSDFAKIDWGKGSCFLKTESAYGESTTQLMSVPYALYAANAGTVDKATIEQFVSNIDFTTYNLVNKTSLANYATTESVNTALANYTTATHLNDTLAVYAKIEDLPEGVNLTGYAKTEDLAAVATSGSYNDLTNKPTNVSAFTNDANYLVASDITGKADKSEMSITNGTGTATIQLKSGTSATVLTQHQSIANNSTIQELQEQVAALQTALGNLKAKVKVKVTYKTYNYSSPYADGLNYLKLKIEGQEITSEKTFELPISKGGLAWDWTFSSGNTFLYGFCAIKVNGVQLTQNICKPITYGKYSLTTSNTSSYSVYDNSNNYVGKVTIPKYELKQNTSLTLMSTTFTSYKPYPTGFSQATEDNMFIFLAHNNKLYQEWYKYNPIPAEMLFSNGSENVVEIVVYAWYNTTVN